MEVNYVSLPNQSTCSASASDLTHHLPLTAHKGLEGMDLPDSICVRYSSAFDVPASSLVLSGSASLSDIRVAILKQVLWLGSDT